MKIANNALKMLTKKKHWNSGRCSDRYMSIIKDELLKNDCNILPRMLIKHEEKN